MTVDITWKKGLIAVASILVLGAACFAGGYSAKPSKVQVITDRETKYDFAVSIQEVKVETVKWQTKTVTEYDTSSSAFLDVDTKCDETFDPITGKRVHRVCERSKHSGQANTNTGGTTASTDGSSQTNTNTNTNASGSGSDHSHTESITTNSSENWALRGDLGVNLKNPAQGLIYGGGAEARLFWTLWLGVWFHSDISGGASFRLALP